MKDSLRLRQEQKVFSTGTIDISGNRESPLYMNSCWREGVFHGTYVVKIPGHSGRGRYNCNGMLAFCFSIYHVASFISSIVIRFTCYMCKKMSRLSFAATFRGRL